MDWSYQILSPGNQLTSAVDEVLQRALESGNTSGMPDKAVRDKVARNLYIQRYFTQRDWDKLTNPRLDETTRIRVVADRCVAIRMKRVDEYSFTRMAAVVSLMAVRNLCI